MKTKKYILLFLFVVFCFTTCKKYPDDVKSPHLQKPEKRIGGPWSIKKVFNYVNNTTIPLSPCSGNDVVTFSSEDFDGEFIYMNYKGTWELIDKKDKLKIIDENNNDHIYIILQLEKNILVLQDDSLKYTFGEYCGP